MAQERLQKILARAGVASRRNAETLIVAGRVRVDGRVANELGTKADVRRQRVELDGRPLLPESLTYVLLHKPRGVVTTLRDPEGRRTACDLVRGLTVRVVPVGRLDYQTSGVLLLTNDGDFSATLQHPRTGVPRVYVAKVRGSVTDEALGHWRQSIEIDGRRTRPAMVRRLRYDADKTWLELTLTEGRNRHVRRLGEAAGHSVLRLARTSYAGITVGELLPGQWRALGVDELLSLRRAYGVPKRVHRPAPTRDEAPRRAPARSAKAGGRKSAPLRQRRGSEHTVESDPGQRGRGGPLAHGASAKTKARHGSVQSRAKKPAVRT